jgi:drug/metabolite transporter (DMT)-like permease
VSRLRADFLLLLNAIIWGAAFVAQKQANDFLGPISFIGFRYLVSALVILPFTLWEGRQTQIALTKRDYAFAGIIGLILFGGMSLQQIGLVTTTATNAGFLTSLYVVITPFAAWFFMRQKPDRRHIFACSVSIIGAWLLSTNGALNKINIGDIQILISDFGWATWIVFVSIFMRRSDRPFFLAFIQYMLAAMLGFSFGLSFEQISLESIQNCFWPIFYAGVFSGGLATTLQGIAQKYTPATDAALIVSLENIFAALSGYIFLAERLTPIGILGCVIIIVAVLIVEIKVLTSNKIS